MEIIIDRESFYGGEVIGGGIVFTDYNIISGAADVKTLGVKLVQRIIRSGSRFCRETTLSYENISSHSIQLQSPLSVAKKGIRKTKRLSFTKGKSGITKDAKAQTPQTSGRTLFTLPTRQDIRGTYADDHVSVEHIIVATARYSTGKLSAWRTIETERRVRITPAIDADSMLDPVQASRTKRIKRFLATCGYVEANMCTHRTGFCAGDTITVNIDVKNTAQEPICEVLMKLRETVQLGSGKEYSRTLLQTGNLIPGERQTIQENGTLATSTSIPVPFETAYSEHSGEVLVFHTLVAELRGQGDKKVMSLKCPVFVATFHSNSVRVEQTVAPSAPPYPVVVAAEENGGGGGGISSPSRGALCVICMNNVQTHCAVPCGHKCLCQACAVFAAKSGVCPMCRQNIETIIRVYD